MSLEIVIFPTYNTLQIFIRVVANHFVDNPLDLICLFQYLAADVHQDKCGYRVDSNFSKKEQENYYFWVLFSWDGIADRVEGAVETEESNQEGDHDGAKDLTLKGFIGVVANLQH